MGSSKRALFTLLVTALSFAFEPRAMQAQEEGRDPDDRFEVEGHLGLYTNLTFPNTRDEKPQTLFTCADWFCSPFQPEIRSGDVGWQGGFRASYDLTRRWAVEYGLNVTQGGNFRYDDHTRFADRPGPVPWMGLDVKRLELRPEGGRLWIHSFNGAYHLRERGRWVPYLTGGANVVSFSRGPRVAFHFSDLTTVSSIAGSATLSAEPSTRWGGNLGSGVKFYLRRHFGIRGDARFLLVNSRFSQRGSMRAYGWHALWPGPPGPFRFGPGVAYQQTGLYSNLDVTFGVFGRF